MIRARALLPVNAHHAIHLYMRTYKHVRLYWLMQSPPMVGAIISQGLTMFLAAHISFLSFAQKKETMVQVLILLKGELVFFRFKVES